MYTALVPHSSLTTLYDALSCQTALLQLGLLSRFQRDIRTLGVQDYAAKPPSNMTYALLQALKTYNEACDSMETQLVSLLPSMRMVGLS